jgi:hypothetical protein
MAGIIGQGGEMMIGDICSERISLDAAPGIEQGDAHHIDQLAYVLSHGTLASIVTHRGLRLQALHRFVGHFCGGHTSPQAE